MTTYREAITAFKAGDRVRLTEDHGDYPLSPVRCGETGTVVENALGAPVNTTLYVKIDHHHHDLVEWDNVLHFYAPTEFGEPEGMDLPIPLEQIDEA